MADSFPWMLLAAFGADLAADAGHEEARPFKVAVQHAAREASQVGRQPPPFGVECLRLHTRLDNGQRAAIQQAELATSLG
jgi:hypothetical protein